MMDTESGRGSAFKGVLTLVVSFSLVCAVAVVAWASQAKNPTKDGVRVARAASAPASQVGDATFGPMPMIGSASRQELYDAAPDFVSVAERDEDAIAGYVAKADLFPDVAPGQHSLPGGVLTVYGRDGVTVVGHFYPGKGFVSLSENPANVPNINPPGSSQSVPPPAN